MPCRSTSVHTSTVYGFSVFFIVRVSWVINTVIFIQSRYVLASTPWAPHYPKSLDTSKEIAKKVKQPCGDACFLSKENIVCHLFYFWIYSTMNIVDWSQQQDQIVLAEEAPSVIQDILRLAPDGSPCDLSIICKQPCYEVCWLCAGSSNIG